MSVYLHLVWSTVVTVHMRTPLANISCLVLPYVRIIHTYSAVEASTVIQLQYSSVCVTQVEALTVTQITIIQQLRVAQQGRLASETPEVREQVKVTQQGRMASEMLYKREAHLQQMAVTQQRRLATETPEDAEARQINPHAKIKF